MKILFVHQNFPGQFKHLAPALVAQGHEVRALSIKGEAVPGVAWHQHAPKRGTTANMHPWASDFETKVIRGESTAAAAAEIRASGYIPDVIVGHPGWGEMLFLRDIWPHTPQLHFLEFYYAAGGVDVGFDPEFKTMDWQFQSRVRAKNANGLLNLEQMDAAYSPTLWQRSSYPQFAQSKTAVVHDGIDTDFLTPNPDAQVIIGKPGITLKKGMQIVTFINRNLEPYRGYHSFMRALPEMQRRCPEAVFILIGSDGVSYGAKAPDGKSWKEIFFAEVRDRIDIRRVAFVGSIPYSVFVSLMQISAAHVYLTYPFVLSWSMLEAMACGAPIIGSATPPVQEVIEHRHNGLLVDFFDYDGLAAQVEEVIKKGHRFDAMRQAARQTIIDRYDLKRICLPTQVDLIKQVAGTSDRRCG